MQVGARPKSFALRAPAAREDTAVAARTPSPAPTEVASPVERPPEEEPTCLDEETDLDRMIACQAEPEPDPLPDAASGSKDDPRTATVKDVLKKSHVPIYDDNNPPSSTSSEEDAPPGSARGILKLAKKEAICFIDIFSLQGILIICGSPIAMFC